LKKQLEKNEQKTNTLVKELITKNTHAKKINGRLSHRVGSYSGNNNPAKQTTQQTKHQKTKKNRLIHRGLVGYNREEQTDYKKSTQEQKPQIPITTWENNKMERIRI
jgi:hypothetical protein